MIATFPKQTNLGHLIRNEREEKNIMQKEAARRCEYSTRQWQYWESGERIPKGRALKAICKLLPNIKQFI
jgi:transcriptional regulator with XRE-family HTH domain